MSILIMNKKTILIILFLMCFVSVKSQHIQLADTLSGFFYIEEIYEVKCLIINNLYYKSLQKSTHKKRKFNYKTYCIVKVHPQNNEFYKIAILTSQTKKKNISANNIYYFVLYPQHNTNFVLGYFGYWDVNFNNNTIRVKMDGWAGNIYTTPYLKGLYYKKRNSCKNR